MQKVGNSNETYSPGAAKMKSSSWNEASFGTKLALQFHTQTAGAKTEHRPLHQGQSFIGRLPH